MTSGKKRFWSGLVWVIGVAPGPLLLMVSLVPGCVQDRPGSQRSAETTASGRAAGDGRSGVLSRLACPSAGGPPREEDPAHLVHLPMVESSRIPFPGSGSRELEVLIFGYARVDVRLQAIKGLFSSPAVIEAPVQRLGVALQPEKSVPLWLRDQIAGASCQKDLEDAVEALKQHFAEQIFFTVELPPMHVEFDTEEGHICGLQIKDVRLNPSESVKVHLNNPQSSWWAPLAVLFGAPAVEALQRMARVISPGGSLATVTGATVGNIFRQDFLASVKTAVGCDRARAP